MNAAANEPTYTAARLSELTGVAIDDIDRLERIGLLHREADATFTADAVDRLTLANYARSRGVTDSQIEQFCADHGDLLASLLRARTHSGSAYTFDEAFAQLPEGAFDEPFLAALLDLVGPLPGEPLTDEDLAALQMTGEALRTGFPAEALLQLIRVMADAAGRVADAENRVFHDYVHERNRADGLTGQDLFDATDAVSTPLLAMAEPALLYLHRRALHRAMREDFVRHLTEDSRPPRRRPGEAAETMLFIDLAGFTPLTLTMGDAAAAAVLTRFASLVRATAIGRHGRIIKQIGDEFMLAFDHPVDAVRFGIDMCHAVARESHFPPVHIGAHHGDVLYRDGDYVGTTVNLAARVAGASRRGQFLITAAVADAVAGTEIDARLDPLPPAALKGMDAPTEMFEVATRTEPAGADIDPVCGMQIHPGTEVETVSINGQDYRFCSTGCRDKFLEHARAGEQPDAGEHW